MCVFCFPQMQSFLTNPRATSTTVSHLATHVQDLLPHVSPQKDVSFLPSIKHRCLKQGLPRRTLYTNYYVGDCSDLVFGVSLVDYATSRGLQEGDIPKLVKICIAEVDKRGLLSEGIYRVNFRPVLANVHTDEVPFLGLRSSCSCSGGILILYGL